MARQALLSFIALLCFSAVAGAQLRITTNKDTLDFTKVKLGFSRDAQIVVQNLTGTTVNVNDMKIVIKNSSFGEFQIIVPQPPVYHVDSADTRTLTLRFVPSVQGFRSAELDIYTDDGIKQVALIGEGSSIQPDIALIPSFVDFGMLTPGEFKDTTVYLIGGDKDSATVTGIGVANFDAALYFDMYPLDPAVTFPVIVHRGDTLKLNVRFSAFNSSGVRTGRGTMEGDVSGSVICDFRGSVGIPDMIFEPEVLDLGIVPEGEVIDTSISILSVGEAPVRLQRIDPPNPPFSVSGLPSFPHNIAAGDSLVIPVHFVAGLPNAYEEPIGAYSKNGAGIGINRTATLRALVVPRVLAKQSPQPFQISCAVDSTYERVLSILDTGVYPITISNIVASSSDFTLSGITTFPDTILPGSKRDIHILFKPTPGNPVMNGSCIIDLLTSGRVILADTIPVLASSENASVAIRTVVSTVVQPYDNTIGIVTVSDLGRYGITSLKINISIAPSDVAEIDTLNASLDNVVFPNASLVMKYDAATKMYVALIISTSPLPASSQVPFLKLPLHYFVAGTPSANLHVSTFSPEKDGCLNFSDDSITISSVGACGDGILRNFMNASPLITGVIASPNPSSSESIAVAFVNSEEVTVHAQLLDMTGRVVSRSESISCHKGQNTFRFLTGDATSGVYSLRLQATSAQGLTQTNVLKIILSR